MGVPGIHLLEGVDEYHKLWKEVTTLITRTIKEVAYVAYKSDRVPWRGFIYDFPDSFLYQCLKVYGFQPGLIPTDKIDKAKNDSFTRRIFLFDEDGTYALALIITDRITTPDVAEGTHDVPGTLTVEWAHMKYGVPWITKLDDHDWEELEEVDFHEFARVGQEKEVFPFTCWDPRKPLNPASLEHPELKEPKVKPYEFPETFKDTLNYTIL